MKKEKKREKKKSEKFRESKKKKRMDERVQNVAPPLNGLSPIIFS